MLKAIALGLGLAMVVPQAWAVQQGEAAPSFQYRDIKTNKEVDLAKYKGKVVLLDFWATWCPPCRMEIPHFVELQKAYKKKGLVIIGVSVDRAGAGVVNSFMKMAGINYRMILDASGELADRYGGIQGIPTTFLIGKDGKIIKWYVGYHEKETFEKDILAALG